MPFGSTLTPSPRQTMKFPCNIASFANLWIQFRKSQDLFIYNLIVFSLCVTHPCGAWACICGHAGMGLWTRGYASVDTRVCVCGLVGVCLWARMQVCVIGQKWILVVFLYCFPSYLSRIETGSLNLVVIDPASLAGQWAPGISCLHPHPHLPGAGVTAVPDSPTLPGPSYFA